MNEESVQTYIGVKYYSESDMSLPLNINAAMEFIKGHEDLDSCTEINTILELYNVKRIFQSRNIVKASTLEELKYIEKKNKEINTRLNVFAKSITDINVVKLFESTSVHYREDFFGYIVDFKAYMHISHTAFSELLKQKCNAIFCALRFKKIVDYYDETVAEYLCDNPVQIAEVVLRVYLTKATPEGNSYYYLPKSLKPADKKKIIHEYINSSQANPNYLKLIVSSADNKSILLDVETRLAAKKGFEHWMKQNFSEDKGIAVGAEVSFDYIDEDIHIDAAGDLPHYTYNKKWIEDNLDYPTLLQNFSTLFEYADYQSRILLVSFDAEIGALERHIGVKGKDDYSFGIRFVSKSILSTVQMQSYRSVLLSFGIQIEEVFEWFFEEYIPKEFDINGFSFKAPTPESSYREKCRDIMAELDGVLKQFHLYTQYGRIDRELFEMNSGSISFDQINSLQNEKYGYCASDDLGGILQLLFSDQSIIAFNKKTQSKYSTFAEALLKDFIYGDDFEFYQVKLLERLLEKEIIHKAENGTIYFDPLKFPILVDLYHRETLCLMYVGDFPYVKDLIMAGDIDTEGTLFSRSEQKYLDYMLNKHRYSNGRDLRNRYMHGNNTQTKEQQFQDYIEMLKIAAIVIIKINQELCYADSLSLDSRVT